MRQVLFELLRQRKPSSIYTVDEVSFKDITHIRVVFAQDQQFFIADSYYTGTWIGPTPLGPTVSERDDYLFALADTLEDVATVISCGSMEEVRKYPGLSERDLKAFYSALNVKAWNFVIELFGMYAGFVHSVDFTFTPQPFVQVVCIKKGAEPEFLGTIVIDMQRKARVVVRTSCEIDTIAEAIWAGLCSLPTWFSAKEITDGYSGC